ncbi:MAG: substrate-binding domain-containing protein [Planctomycetota bacterium]
MAFANGVSAPRKDEGRSAVVAAWAARLASVATAALAACDSAQEAPPAPISNHLGTRVAHAASHEPAHLTASAFDRRLAIRDAIPAAPGGAGAPAPAGRRVFSVRVSRLVGALGGAALEDAFERANPDWDLVILPCSDRGGIEEVSLGRVEAALVAVPPSAKDLDQGVRSRLLGYHAAAPVVAPSSTVRNISAAQLRGILTGTVQKWQEVAYYRGSIRVAVGPDCLETQRLLGLLIPGEKLTASARRADSPDALVSEVGPDPASLGIVSLAALDRLGGARPVAVDGVTPSAAHIQQGRYPFAAEVHVVFADTPSPAVRALGATRDTAAAAARWLGLTPAGD